jgi:hypothetical protein
MAADIPQNILIVVWIKHLNKSIVAKLKIFKHLFFELHWT